MNTNEIISYDLSTSPNLEQIKRMLDKAFKKFHDLTGLIFHSDQGWQYQHSYYRKRLSKQHIVQSMSRKGNCYDNSIMETFFGRMKNEMYYGYEKIINLLKNSRMQLKNIFTTTTTKEFRKKTVQNGCQRKLDVNAIQHILFWLVWLFLL